jgi:hypothetical protein
LKRWVDLRDVVNLFSFSYRWIFSMTPFVLMFYAYM